MCIYIQTHLEVGVVSISVLIISVGKFSVLVVVWNPTEGGVVIVAGVEDLVYHLLCLLLAHLPHRQDGAQGAASDTLLDKEPNRTFFYLAMRNSAHYM